MSAITRTNGCGYCRKITGADWQSHQRVDANGIVTCPVIIAKESCKYCKERGHYVGECLKLAEKKKREDERATKLEKNFPALAAASAPAPAIEYLKVGHQVKLVKPALSYAQKIAENRPAKMTAALEKEFEDRKVADQQAKQKKTDDWQKKQEERKQWEKEQKKWREQKHVQDMFDKYGTNWHNCVYMTDEDCETAYQLRNEEDDQQCRREEEMEKYCKEQEELRQKLKAELTPDEYQEWEWEQDDEYFNSGFNMQSEFACRASPAANAYFMKHGLMLPDGDFVSSEWGAERKLDKVRRERKAAEAKQK